MYYFASDIHLGAGDNVSARHREMLFVRWLDQVAADAEAIFLVGDIFDFWFEYKRVVPKGFVRTLGKIAELTDRGIRVVFITGNHDMWIGDYFRDECGMEVYTAPREFELAGRRFFLAHGDNMNIRNKPVLRFMNTIFRSHTMRVCFSWALHPDLALKFGQWWSGKSRKSHTDEGFDERLTDPLIEYARQYLQHHKVDFFVFGHMHFERDYRDGALRVVSLGGWERCPMYAVLDGEGNLTLKRI